VTSGDPADRLGMILKGYPRISESFISTEILLLERLGIPVEILSLRRPRERFCHGSVKEIRAPVTYTPEYVKSHWRELFASNRIAVRRLGPHYRHCLVRALARAAERRKFATFRHFLQAGHLAALRMLGGRIRHLHAHFCHTPTSVALFASELTGLPFSFTGHAKDIYTSEPGQLRRKLRRARFAVTCTRYNARYLADLADGGNTPVHTVYHGIDLDFFGYGPAPEPAPPFRILSIGRLVEKKGYDDLLRALKILHGEGLDFRFDHIGSGDEEGEMRRMVRDSGLESRVWMHGTLPHEKVIDYYRNAHCFALACRVAANGDRDGIPNVLVEAMAVGVPVVATRVSAIPELVEDGLTGSLVEPERPEAMAAAVRRVLLRPGPAREMLPAARRKVEAEFDNRRNILKLFEIHRAALGADLAGPVAPARASDRDLDTG
jgi:glycosyltransferase involved in cell wall biosynthesis